MTVQYLLVLFLITRDGTYSLTFRLLTENVLVRMENVFSMNGEIDSIISFPCEIDQLPANAVVSSLQSFESISNHSLLDHLGISTGSSFHSWNSMVTFICQWSTINTE